MSIPTPSFTIGIEEEYLLTDLESRDLVRAPPDSFMEECVKECGGAKHVGNEFLKSQIEIGTRVCKNITEARDDLKRLRSKVSKVAQNYGWGIAAASTHPFAEWSAQEHVDKSRYNELHRDFAAAADRLLICGMHVHVGIEDDDLRIDLMNQLAYFLPHILSLTTSSPFWMGRDTGLNSYRLTVFDAMPRTGLPDFYESYSQYQRMVKQLIKAGVLEDATKIWWDVRPSDKFPTIEARVMDVCTRLEDAVCVAALVQSILSMLFRLRKQNQRWRIYPNIMVRENRWRAQRYGPRRELIDFGKGEMVAANELIGELIGLVREDAERLGCLEQVEHAREIVERGTSAEAQRNVYAQALNDGADEMQALKTVVDFLVSTTKAGL